MAKQDDYIKTALRLPRELHQLLMESASVRGHSLNTEMIYRIYLAFRSSRSLDEERQAKISAVLKGMRGTIEGILQADKDGGGAPQPTDESLPVDLSEKSLDAIRTIVREERKHK